MAAEEIAQQLLTGTDAELKKILRVSSVCLWQPEGLTVPRPFSNVTTAMATTKAIENLASEAITSSSVSSTLCRLVQIACSEAWLPLDALYFILKLIVKQLVQEKNVVAPTPDSERSQALEALSQFTRKKVLVSTSQPLVGLIQLCARSLHCSAAVELVKQLIEEKNISIRWFYLFELCEALEHESLGKLSTLFLETLNPLLQQSLDEMNSVQWIRALTVLRWIDSGSPKPSSRYEEWFQNLVAINTQKTQQLFLVAQLTAIIRWDNAAYLKIHLGALSRKTAWRSIVGDYLTMARLRLAELVHETTVGVLTHVSTSADLERDSTEIYLQSILRSYLTNKRVPSTIMDASSLRRLWFEQQFLPLLASAHLDNELSEARDSILAELKSKGKVPDVLTSLPPPDSTHPSSTQITINLAALEGTLRLETSCSIPMTQEQAFLLLQNIFNSAETLTDQFIPQLRSIHSAISTLTSNESGRSSLVVSVCKLHVRPLSASHLALADLIVHLWLRACALIQTNLSVDYKRVENVLMLIDATTVSATQSLQLAIMARLWLFVMTEEAVSFRNQTTRTSFALILVCLACRSDKLPQFHLNIDHMTLQNSGLPLALASERAGLTLMDAFVLLRNQLWISSCSLYAIWTIVEAMELRSLLFGVKAPLHFLRFLAVLSERSASLLEDSASVPIGICEDLCEWLRILKTPDGSEVKRQLQAVHTTMSVHEWLAWEADIDATVDFLSPTAHQGYIAKYWRDIVRNQCAHRFQSSNSNDFCEPCKILGLQCVIWTILNQLAMRQTPLQALKQLLLDYNIKVESDWVVNAVRQWEHKVDTGAIKLGTSVVTAQFTALFVVNND